MIDERTEMYLKAIGQMEDEGEPATTSGLARHLDVSMPSVTEMLQRLTAKELVIHEPRGPIRLSEEGQRLASSLMRRHRLWENFLVEFLGFTWDKVHEEACRLEHATSPALEERLAGFIGDLKACPHGHAVPDKQGHRRTEPAVPLTEFPSHEGARVVRIHSESPELLRLLARLGIRPGRVLHAEGLEGGGRAVRVRINGHVRRVPVDSAEQVMVERAIWGEPSPETTVPLSEMRPNESGTIVELSGGEDFRTRALSLGCTPGTQVNVKHNTGRGPVIVTLSDTRVGLERGEAERLRVKRTGARR